MSEKPVINILLLINRMHEVMSTKDFENFCSEIELYIERGYSLIQAYALALTRYSETP